MVLFIESTSVQLQAHRVSINNAYTQIAVPH